MLKLTLSPSHSVYLFLRRLWTSLSYPQWSWHTLTVPITAWPSQHGPENSGRGSFFSPLLSSPLILQPSCCYYHMLSCAFDRNPPIHIVSTITEMNLYWNYRLKETRSAQKILQPEQMTIKNAIRLCYITTLTRTLLFTAECWMLFHDPDTTLGNYNIFLICHSGQGRNYVGAKEKTNIISSSATRMFCWCVSSPVVVFHLALMVPLQIWDPSYFSCVQVWGNADFISPKLCQAAIFLKSLHQIDQNGFIKMCWSCSSFLTF